MNLEKQIRIKGSGLPWITITKDNWTNLIDVVRKVIPGTPMYNCILLYGVCPNSIVSSLSHDFYNLYKICGGVSRVRTPDEYYSLPALYVDVCDIIDQELSRYKEKKPDADK